MAEQFSNDLLLLEKLAQGGMAEVFRAKQIGVGGFQKNVALKRILPECARVDEFKQMFLRETGLAAILQHPNIIQVFSTGERDGYLYLVMEFLDGKTLQDVFDLLSVASVPAPLDICCFIIAEAAKGLAYAHNARDPKTNQALNVVHRDISPHNIMVSYDGGVKVVDFGIAKAKNSADLTQVGIIKGKEGYLAPELVKGAEADNKSDLFALGVVLYEMLTGKFLFDGDTTLDTLKAIDHCDIPEIIYKGQALDPELDRIMRKSLAKNPKERYQTCEQLAKELTVFLNKKFPGFTSSDLSDFMYALYKEKIEQERQLRESEDVKIPENAWEEMGATAVFQIPDEFRKIVGATGNIIIQQTPIVQEVKSRELESFRSKLARTGIWTAAALVISTAIYFISTISFEAVFSKSPGEFWAMILQAKGYFDPKTFELKVIVVPTIGFAVCLLLKLSLVGIFLGGLLGSRARILDVFLSLLSYVTFLFVTLLGFNCISLLQKIQSTSLWFVTAIRASVEQIVQIVHLSPAISVVRNQVGGKTIKEFIADKIETARLLLEADLSLKLVDKDIKVLGVAKEEGVQAVSQALNSNVASDILSQIFTHSLLSETFLGLFAFGFLVVLSNSVSRHFLFREKRKKLFQFYFAALQLIVFFAAVNMASLVTGGSVALPLVGFISMPSGVFAPLIFVWIVFIFSTLALQLFVGTERE